MGVEGVGVKMMPRIWFEEVIGVSVNGSMLLSLQRLCRCVSKVPGCAMLFRCAMYMTPTVRSCRSDERWSWVVLGVESGGVVGVGRSGGLLGWEVMFAYVGDGCCCFVSSSFCLEISLRLGHDGDIAVCLPLQLRQVGVCALHWR